MNVSIIGASGSALENSGLDEWGRGRRGMRRYSCYILSHTLSPEQSCSQHGLVSTQVTFCYERAHIETTVIQI